MYNYFHPSILTTVHTLKVPFFPSSKWTFYVDDLLHILFAIRCLSYWLLVSILVFYIIGLCLYDCIYIVCLCDVLSKTFLAIYIYFHCFYLDQLWYLFNDLCCYISNTDVRLIVVANDKRLTDSSSVSAYSRC